MNEQPTPPMPDDGATLPPPTPPTPPVDDDGITSDPPPTPRSGPGRTRQIAAVAAVAAGVAITAGIAVAARDDTATTTTSAAAASPTSTTVSTGALPDLGTTAVEDAPPALGDMPAPGALPDGAMAFPGGGRHGGPHGDRGEFGGAAELDQVPAFDQTGGDAATAVAGQMPQGGAPDAASQGS